MKTVHWVLSGVASLIVIAMVAGIIMYSTYWDSLRECPVCNKPLGYHSQVAVVDSRTYHFSCVYRLEKIKQ